MSQEFKEILDSSGQKWKFFPVEDPSIFLPVLKERHPVSCMMYNQVIQSKLFKDVQTFYTIGEKVNSNTWIFSKVIRKDYGCNYTISAPVAIADGTEPVPDHVKECILSGGVIQWNMTDDIMFFTPQTPVPVAKMIAELSADQAGNITEIHPGFLYYIEIEDALKLQVGKPQDPSVEVRRLNTSEADFLVNTWVYSRPGSKHEFEKYLARNPSGAVFVDGKFASGVHIPAIGFVSALYTLEEHRGKGYAKLTMSYTFKEYAKGGCIPCVHIETGNKASIKFHEGLGLKNATKVYGILVKKYTGG